MSRASSPHTSFPLHAPHLWLARARRMFFVTLFTFRASRHSWRWALPTNRLFVNLRAFSFSLVCLLLCSFVTQAATGNKLYTYDTTRIYQLDPFTGASTPIYTFPAALAGAYAIAQSPNDGTIFYINGGVGGGGSLCGWSPATGATTPCVGSLPYIPRLAFNSAGALYGMTAPLGASGSGTLYTINTASGAATTVNTYTNNPGPGGDIAFGPDGVLYMANGQTLYTVPLAAGSTTIATRGNIAGMAANQLITGLGFYNTNSLLLTTVDTANGSTQSALYSVADYRAASYTATTLRAVTNISPPNTPNWGDITSENPPDPDLSITKTDGVATIAPGAAVTYTVVITNNSAFAVKGTLTDTVPATISGTTWTCAATAGSTCAASSGSGNSISTSATLLAGGKATYTVTGTLSASASGTLSNTASVAVPFYLTDATPANNSATDTDTIAFPPPDVALLKSVSPTGTILPGADLTYTIQFTNSGGQAARSLVFGDGIPLNTDYKLSSATTSGGSTGLTFAVEFSSDYVAPPASPAPTAAQFAAALAAATWVYTPVSGAGGAPANYDRAVKAIRWRVTAGNLSQTAPNNTGSVGFTVRIR